MLEFLIKSIRLLIKPKRDILEPSQFVSGRNYKDTEYLLKGFYVLEDFIISFLVVLGTGVSGCS